MELAIYTDHCLTCSESDRVFKVKQFAKDNNLTFRMKSAYIIKEWQEEAIKIGAKMPFIYLNGETTDFYEISRDPNVATIIRGI